MSLYGTVWKSDPVTVKESTKEASIATPTSSDRRLRPHRSILMVLYYYRPYVSGLSEVARILSENLVKEGYSVTVLTTRYDPSLKKREMLNGVNILRIPVLMKVGKGVIAPALSVKAILLSPRFDHVCFHLPLAEAGFAARFIEKSKLSLFYHCDIKLGKSPIDRMIEKVAYLSMASALRRAKEIIVTSTDYLCHSRFAAYLGKAVAIPPPIEDFRFQEIDSSPLRRFLCLNESTFLIGFVGRIVREKGLQYLLSAIPYLVDHIPDFRILVAGEYKNIAGGSVKEEFDHFLQEHPGKILFTGFLEEEDLVRFYSMIDVLVLPSVDALEAFGMVQVEAMLCGTPVVASNLPGVREVIRTVGFGCLAEPAQPADIALKIISIYRDKPQLDPMRLQPLLLKHTIPRFMAVWS
jgi:glycosyltransferase involved in cell wall biosynthesis